MSSTKLKNAPLKEVIFELFWDCSIDGTGLQIDEGFDLAQGVFSNQLKSDFPVHKKLIPENIPFKVFGAPIPSILERSNGLACGTAWSRNDSN